MANPQKENGYTPISNELFEAIVAFRIPGEIRQVFDAVLRKTYGYNKKEDSIANSQLVALTKMKKQNVSRSIAALVDHKLVIKSDDRNGDGNVLKINKDYQQWVQFGIKSDDKKKAKKLSSKRMKRSSKVMTPVIRSDDKVSSEVMDTKDKNILKDNIQKTGKASAKPTPVSGEQIEDARKIRDIIEAFGKLNPACKKMYGNKNQREACLDLVKEYTFEKVMFIIEVTLPKTNGIAFFPTITTPHQLFLKWADLEAAAKKWKSKVEIKNQEKGRGLA